MQGGRVEEVPNDPPPSIDWRMSNVLTPVRHQGDCNCCWAIAATGACESALAIMTGRDPVQLSIQELINCVNEDPDSDREDDHGCYTSSISRAFKWIRQNGILREDECPFVGERQPCAPKLEPHRAFRIEGFVRIKDGDEAQLLRCIASRPVAASIKITRALMQLTGEDIYEGPPGEDFRVRTKDGELRICEHAVLLTGYGTSEDGRNYYVIRNSWGTDWGNNGFGKVLRDSSRPGRLSLLIRASYPILF